MKRKQAFTIKTLTKRSVWDIQENDVFRFWKDAERDADLKDNKHHYLSTIATAFEVEEITVDKPEVIKKYKERGFKVGVLKGIGGEDSKWGVKKRRIVRVTDLTYDNIHNVSASQLLEIIDRNFGGGWDSLSQNTQNIIQSQFDIATTNLPKDRLHNPGGIYDKKLSEQYEALEIPKGTWVEVIFAKEKPEIIIPDKSELDAEEDKDKLEHLTDEEGIYAEGDNDFVEEYEHELKAGDELDDIFGNDDYDEDFGSDNDELTLDDVVAAEDEG